jgi:nitroimidazol reductase NimA-like FMN-containing flavoprotein (pyridoxamine 5'-phosphate oxidase superfamily)
MTMRRVDELLDRIEHATIATVSADGRPWNTPVYFARDRDSFYWISRRNAQHSTNIRHNGLAFVVIFDSSRDDSTGAGVYIEATATELTNEGEIHGALERIYRRREKPVPPVSHFFSGSTHAAYHAQAVSVWSNVLHTSGEIPWDERVEISLASYR